jgi:hypothetical protein
VNRRAFLATGMTLAGSLSARAPAGHELTAQQAAEWLAWEAWHQAGDLHHSQVPSSIARVLARHPQVAIDSGSVYRFTDPALVDVLVAQRVFGDITTGSSRLLATAQTSHATDLAIGAMAAHDDTARRALAGWMRQGATAVLRVNAAGVLAKVGTPDSGDAAITVLADDRDARCLYLTAVASRVLNKPWERAAQLAIDVNRRTPAASGLAEPRDAWPAGRLAAELSNGHDAAARWCATVLLAHLYDQAPEVARAALSAAIRREPCRENLRAYAAVLAGGGPLMI